MRTHFYPEGGWGWLVCAAGFLALLLTTGMQLAFGLLHLYAARHLGEHHLMDIGMSGVSVPGGVIIIHRNARYVN